MRLILLTFLLVLTGAGTAEAGPLAALAATPLLTLGGTTITVGTAFQLAAFAGSIAARFFQEQPKAAQIRSPEETLSLADAPLIKQRGRGINGGNLLFPGVKKGMHYEKRRTLARLLGQVMGPADGVETFFILGREVFTDANGLVLTPPYNFDAGGSPGITEWAWLLTKEGTADQTAFEELVENFQQFTTKHRGENLALTLGLFASPFRPDFPESMNSHTAVYPNGKPTFSTQWRGSKIYDARRVARTNRITNSEDLTGYTLTNGTVTANAATAPDGTTTADKFVEDTSADAVHHVSKTATAANTNDHSYSLHLKAGERTTVEVLARDGASTYYGFVFDMVSGAISAPVTGGVVDGRSYARAVHVGGGWWRVFVDAIPLSGTSLILQARIVVSGDPTYTGNGSSGFYSWGWQAEEGAYASAYIKSGGSATARANPQDFDDPLTWEWSDNGPAHVVDHLIDTLTGYGFGEGRMVWADIAATLDKADAMVPLRDRNLVRNPDFDDDSYLVLGTDWSVAGGHLVKASGTDSVSRLEIEETIEAGVTYDYSLEIDHIAATDFDTQTSAADLSWYGIAWAPSLGLFAAVAYSGTGSRVMTSPDGETWTLRSTPADNSWLDVCWSPDLSLFVAVAQSGSGNRVMTSSNGTTWTIRTSAADLSWRKVVWASSLGLFVAIASSSATVMTSPDGINWTSHAGGGPSSTWRGLAWSEDLGILVAVAQSGTGNRVKTSTDGINWTSRTTPADNDWRSVCWSPELGLFVAVAESGTGNRVMTSANGITWTLRSTPADNNWTAVEWSPELMSFCAVAATGSGNRAMTSPDGVNWTLRTSAADNSWYAIAWSPAQNIFAAVGLSGTGNRVMTGAPGRVNLRLAGGTTVAGTQRSTAGAHTGSLTAVSGNDRLVIASLLGFVGEIDRLTLHRVREEKRSRCWGPQSTDEERGRTLADLLLSTGTQIVRMRDGYSVRLIERDEEATFHIPADCILEYESGWPEEAETPNIIAVKYREPRRRFEMSEMPLGPDDTNAAWARDAVNIAAMSPRVFTLDLPYCPSHRQAAEIAQWEFAKERGPKGTLRTNLYGIGVFGRPVITFEDPITGETRKILPVNPEYDADGVSVMIPFFEFPVLDPFDPATDEPEPAPALQDAGASADLPVPTDMAARIVEYPDGSFAVRATWTYEDIGSTQFLPEAVFRQLPTDDRPDIWRVMTGPASKSFAESAEITYSSGDAYQVRTRLTEDVDREVGEFGATVTATVWADLDTPSDAEDFVLDVTETGNTREHDIGVTFNAPDEIEVAYAVIEISFTEPDGSPADPSSPADSSDTVHLQPGKAIDFSRIVTLAFDSETRITVEVTIYNDHDEASAPVSDFVDIDHLEGGGG